MIKRQGHGARETFTVRKQSFGVGVERTFPVHSPKIERIEVAARGDVRRAKLYYLRDRVGKRARVRERRWGDRGRPRAREPRRPRPSTPRASPQSEAEAEVVDAEERGDRGAEADEASDARRRQAEGGRGKPPSEDAERLAPSSSRRNPRTKQPDSEADEGRGRTASRRLSPLMPRSRTTGRGAFVELVVIVALALGLALVIQAFIVKPYRIPSRVDGADARHRPAGARQPDRLPLRRPRDRRHRRLPPARGRDRRKPAVRRPDERGRGLPAAGRPGVGHQLHQADRRRARATRSRSSDGHPVVNGVEAKEPFISPCGGGHELQPPHDDHDPARTTTS